MLIMTRTWSTDRNISCKGKSFQFIELLLRLPLCFYVGGHVHTRWTRKSTVHRSTWKSSLDGLHDEELYNLNNRYLTNKIKHDYKTNKIHVWIKYTGFRDRYYLNKHSKKPVHACFCERILWMVYMRIQIEFEITDFV